MSKVVEKATKWWLAAWGINSTILITLAFIIPFKWWAIAVIALFAPYEAVGVLGKNPKYPPLTDVIRVYVPRWAALAVIWGFGAAAASEWGVSFHHTIPLALFFVGLGWVTNHFINRYNQPASD